MSLQAVREALTRRPFEPFRIRLSSGDAYDVRHPEFAWLTRGGVYVGLPTEGEDLPERAVFCSMLHVAALEALAPSSAS